MSGLGSWLWGTSQLDDAVDKATSELLPTGSEDIALNLEICDQIRSKSVPAKEAMRALKRRLNHKNPNVQLLALGLTDTCIKNGGDHFLVEVASREFQDNLVSILKMPGLNHEVKDAILRHIQNWSIAFEGKYALGYVGQLYKTLQGEGYKFPPKDLAVVNSAMVDTQTAPEWIDSDVCLRCRTAFSFTNRKHHCRNCGQVFDQQCSSKTLPLPHFGITQEVRVCDGCHTKLARKADKTDKRNRSNANAQDTTRHRSAQELADAELQRAIEMSLQETNKARGYAPRPSEWQPSEPPITTRKSYSDHKTVDNDEDPDLKAAIEASLREANAPRPSAPVAPETPRVEESSYTYNSHYTQSYTPAPVLNPPLPKLPSCDMDPLETDAILSFNQTVEQVQAQGGRDLSRYPAVTELYDRANSVRPKLALSLDDTGRKQEMLSDMHDKLSQAVKLYDHILTEQVMHPRWRTVSPTQYQPAPSSYSYNQFAPSMTPVPQTTHMASQPVPAQFSPRAGYTHQPQWSENSNYTSAQSQPPDRAVQSFGAAQAPLQVSPIPELSRTISSGPMNSYTSSYVPQVPQPPQPPMTATTSAPLTHNSTYVSPNQPQAFVGSSGPSSLPPHQYQHAPPTTALPLTRSHTVSHSGFQGNSVQQQYSAQQDNPLPQFPSVPTTAPVTLYDHTPRHNGFAQSEERKEALLIDL